MKKIIFIIIIICFLADVWYLKGETDSEKILKNGHFLNQLLLDKGYAVRI